jgi:hypothetical protein
MKVLNVNSLKQYLEGAKQWLYQTPERSLEQAYDAALTIKAIEDEHFGGNKITMNSNQHSENVLIYFQDELKKYLKITRIRLSEFKISRSVLNNTDFRANAKASVNSSASLSVSGNGDQPSAVLEKLKFIDEILRRYESTEETSLSLVPVDQPPTVKPNNIKKTDVSQLRSRSEIEDIPSKSDSVLDKTGVLPRSILGTLNRIKRELDPKSEEQVIQNFRSAKVKTVISVRFILLLIIIPLLTQQLTKNFLIGPAFNVFHFRSSEVTEIFINEELEEEALVELQRFEEKLRFERLLGKVPEVFQQELTGEIQELTPEEEAAIEQKLLQDKAREIASRYRGSGTDAIANIFADLASLIAFVVVVATNKREIAILKSFIDETVYGLSDSAKAFIIILFTDMFVGFHSPHGWEVLLEGVARHLGLPANRDFIFLFIATFPVILDTIFKYWIFRYLNRISPSAVATYRNMNES